MKPTFLVLFSIIGVFSVFAGINAIVKRSQVINGVRKIRDGEEETMKKFKDGAEGYYVMTSSQRAYCMPDEIRI